MIPAANRYTVMLDASVLFPNMKRDILLRFFEADLYRARWTERIHNEWIANAKDKYPHYTQKLDRTEALVREHFDDAWVFHFEEIEASVTLPDPDDRHVLAAAIRCGAQYIVTDNIRDFPVEVLEKYDLEAGTADRFLSGTFEHYTANALSDLRAHRASLRSQPSPEEYLMLLRQKHLPLLASRVMEHVCAL